MSNLSHQIQLAMLNDEINILLNQRQEIELIVSDLQADRGEDQLVENSCSKVLKLIRNT